MTVRRLAWLVRCFYSAHMFPITENRRERMTMTTSTKGTDVSYLNSEHRDRAWRDRFNARWHYDCGGWIRTRPQDDASTFALIPDERYGPFVEDDSCPYCLVMHPPQECPGLSGNVSRVVASDYDTSPNKTQADTAADNGNSEPTAVTQALNKVQMEDVLYDALWAAFQAADNCYADPEMDVIDTGGNFVSFDMMEVVAHVLRFLNEHGYQVVQSDAR